MKWIGQHIWDFISRFRTTVYLENLETSSEENVLVVDSNGKVTKNTTLGGSDLTITNASDNRVVTSTGGSGLNAESGVTYDGTTFAVGSFSYVDVAELLTISGDDAASQPALLLQNNHTGAVGPALTFQKSATGDDNDQLGKITFSGKDDGGAANTYAEIEGYIVDASAGAEEGKLILSVASHDGEVQPGLTMTSGDAEDEVDVTIGNGANSVIDTAGIFRGSNIGTIQDTFIPVLPTDFNNSSSYRFLANVGGNGQYITASTASVYYYAQKIIPKGYTATSCTVYGLDSDANSQLRCYETDIVGTAASAVVAATTISSGAWAMSFTSNIVGDGQKACTIYFDPGDTADRIYGGKIEITKTT